MMENEGLRDELVALQAEKAELDTAMEEHTQQYIAHIRELSGELERGRERAKSMWRLNCEQLARYDAELVEKESKIAALKTQLKTEKRRNREVIVLDARVAGGTEAVEHQTSRSQTTHKNHSTALQRTERRGQAPPVDPFTGENQELRIDDWLPNLEHAATWYNWTDEE